MGRHRRIKKEKRTKLKSVDPFNRKAKELKDDKFKKRNAPPRLDAIDNQPIPHSTRFVTDFHDKPPEIRKKKRNRDPIQTAVATTGLKWDRSKESFSQLLRRVTNDVHEAVSESKQLAKFGLIGRSNDELDADLAEMEAKQKAGKKKQTDPTAEGKQKGGRKERKKQERRERQDRAKHEDNILNGRDNVAFGERADAPPSWSSSIRRQREKLKNTKKRDNQDANAAPEPSKKAKTQDQSIAKEKKEWIEAERTRVMEAYKAVRAQRHRANMAAAAAANN